MRPIKLTMTSFGPFANTQTVDFAKITDGIFLITGNTGAGKTTIFDAICYALFASASGDTRQSENFKSDYADESDICSVTLDFTVNGKEYSIYRRPKQDTISKRTGKLSSLPAKAELTMPDKSVISGARETVNEIENILHLNCSQFKKIVMLAQGEFQKLLSAKSDEKQEIFRKIFDTDIFEAFSAELATRTSELSDKLKDSDKNMSALSSSFITQNEELIALINSEAPDYQKIASVMAEQNSSDEASLSELSKELKEKEKRAFELYDLLQSAQTLKEKRERLGNFTQQYETLIANSENIAKLKRDIELSDKLHDKMLLRIKMRELLQSQTEYERAVGDLKENLRENELTLAKASDNAKVIPTLQKQLDTISQKSAVIKINSQRLLKLKEINDFILKRNALLKKRAAQSETLNILKSRAQFSALRLEYSERLGKLSDISEKTDNYSSLYSDYIKLNETYQKHHAAFWNMQAAVLADGLKDGIPCPVCGSTEHPKKAKFFDSEISQQKIDSERKSLENSAQKLTELRSRIISEFSLLVQNTDSERENTNIASIRNTVKELSGKISIDIADTDKNIMLEEQKLSSRLNNIDSVNEPRFFDVEYIDSEIKKNIENVAAIKENITSLTVQADEIKIELTEEFDSEEKLKSAESRLKAAYNRINDEISSLRNAFDLALRENAALNSALKSENERLSKTSDELKKVSDALDGSDLNELDNLISRRNEIDSSRRTVSEYDEKVSSLTSNIRLLTDDINVLDSKIPNDIEESAAAAKDEYSLLKDKTAKKATSLDINKKVLERTEKLISQSTEIRTQYLATAELNRIASGNNEKRISFERYVLASYFDDVIKFANKRLEKMSDSRYSLRRREEREKFGKASGLDLEIFDSYTGSARHINTLSGGESFKASLSLALGLADIITMRSGAVSIETMFIDEGFGTLDPHSLDSAIEALLSLSQNSDKYAGRFVGIISHVPELQEKIRSKIVVSSSRSGSTINMRGVYNSK